MALVFWCLRTVTNRPARVDLCACRALVFTFGVREELSDADAMQRSQRDLAEQRIAEAQTKVCPFLATGAESAALWQEKEEGAEKAKRIELLALTCDLHHFMFQELAGCTKSCPPPPDESRCTKQLK